MEEYEERYLNEIIVNLENQPRMQSYVALSGREEIPRPYLPLHPSFAGYVKRERSPKTHYIRTIEDAVSHHPQFVLVGDSGSGKTTILEKMVLEAARTHLKWLQEKTSHEPPLPLLLYLGDWKTRSDITDFVQEQWAIKGMRQNILHELTMGRVRLYLDGLNEMGQEGAEKARALHDWVEQLDGPRYLIVTCRNDDYSGQLKLGDLPVVRVDQLDRLKIEQFTYAHITEMDKADAFLEAIFSGVKKDTWRPRDREPQSLIYLARNPYMLAALITVYEEKGVIPSNAGSLFKALVSFLWERERQVNTVGWIPIEEMLDAFGRLSFEMIAIGTPLNVPISFVTKIIQNPSLLNAGISAGFFILSGDFVKFSHQLMMEYFAAHRLQKVDFTAQLEKPYHSIRMVTWDRIIISLCGISESPDDIITKVVVIDPYLAAMCLESEIQLSNANTCTIVIQELSKIIKDQSEHLHTRRGAIQHLGKIPNFQEVIPVLFNTLDDSDPDIQKEAMWVLGDIGGDEVVSQILPFLQNPNANLRENAAWTIGDIGDNQYLPYLVKALDDTDADVRVAAIDSIVRIGAMEVLPELERMRQDMAYTTRSGKRVCDLALEAIDVMQKQQQPD